MDSAAPPVRRDAEQSDRDGRAPLFRVHGWLRPVEYAGRWKAPVMYPSTRENSAGVRRQVELNVDTMTGYQTTCPS